MKIRVNDIRESGKKLEATEPISNYPSLVAMQEAEECEFLSPLHVELNVSREYDHIRVQGQVGTKIRLHCSRCLIGFEAELASRFTIIYSKSFEIPFDEEVELGEEDLVSISYTGEEIDFAPEVAEQVLLEIPYKPLCQEECRGLCSICGADLNSASCDCEREPVNIRMSALKNLTIKK